MIQSPAATPLTVVPLIVHTAGVSELNSNARPELAEAVTVVVLPTVKEPGEKLIDPMLWASCRFVRL
jgi:hypothetical protein